MIGKIIRIYKDDSTGGRPFEAAIMATNDSDYQEYIETEMGHKVLFHLCRCKQSRCKYKGHNAFDELLHVDRFRILEYKEARTTVKAWRECVGDGDAMSAASWESRDRGSQKAEFLREDPSLTQSSSRNEPKGPRLPKEPPRGSGDKASDDEPELEELSPKRSKGLGAEGRRPDRAGQALDAALDGLDAPAPPAGGDRDAAPSSGDRSRSAAEQKVAALRAKLHAKKRAFESTQKGNAASTEHLGDEIAPQAHSSIIHPKKGRRF